MFHKNKNQKEANTFPFTESHIKKFKSELEQAGGFEELMVKKKAMKKENEITFVTTFDEIESYKKAFLTGEYESLQPFYDTEMPYTFWIELYRILQRREYEQGKE
jgi:hypothetical protein